MQFLFFFLALFKYPFLFCFCLSVWIFYFALKENMFCSKVRMRRHKTSNFGIERVLLDQLYSEFIINSNHPFSTWTDRKLKLRQFETIKKPLTEEKIISEYGLMHALHMPCLLSPHRHTIVECISRKPIALQ